MRQTYQPKRLRDELFNRLFKEAEIASFSKNELREYEDSLKAYRDIKNSIDTAEEKGRAEGKAEVARKLLAMGLTIQTISEATGLAEDEIKKLLIGSGET